MNYIYSFVSYISFLLFLSGGLVQEETSPLPSTTIMSPAQVVDSLALVAIYQSTVGAAWDNRWNLNQPVDQWYGIDLDSEGYVTKIQLNSNNLQGTLPNQIGDFSRIEHLQLDNNNIGGTIPTTIGQLKRLTIVFLDNNQFIGNIPESLGTIPPLQTIFLDNNQLVGAVPQSFTNLINLWTLDIFNNQIDSVPDLSGINLQRNRLRVFGNSLTFDDIIPNVGRALGDNYIDQDSFFQTTTLNALTGQGFVIDLRIDGTINNNEYQWYKNGVPFGPVRNENKLRFTDVGWGDGGVYHCQVTNPDAPLLTLYSRAITLQISCGESFGDLQGELCFDEQRTVNGVVFDRNNPAQDIFLPGQDRYGCDSTLRVNFTIRDRIREELDTMLCPGESLLLNGRTYNAVNPSGTERFIGAGSNGCDSLLEISIDYFPDASTTISDTICTGTFIFVNGNRYDESRPTGTEIITGGSASGCDSTIFIDLNITTSINTVIDNLICPNEFIISNGNRYDILRPNGTEQLTTLQGCDSIIQIALRFFTPSNTLIQETLCENDSFIVAGQIFDQNRPTGTVTLSDQRGCDSTLQIQLSFTPSPEGLLELTLCENESIQINGTTYNQSRPTGSETLIGSSLNGCDSIININLDFEQTAIGTINPILCFDESIQVNGTTYNRTNPTGRETLVGVSSTGCDSTIIVDLSFHDEAYFLFEPEICEDGFFIYNGQIYDRNNPAGLITLPGRASNGCDSIVDLRLQISSQPVGFFRDTFCANEIVWVGNRRFTQNNSSGRVELENFGHTCDSIVEVDLHFLPVAMSIVDNTLCDSDFLTINGTIYDINNPNGMETLIGGSSAGCDSTIIINLQFAESTFGAISDPLCDNEQIDINGEIFNVNRPNGTVTLPGAASNGCDSIILVDLSFSESSNSTISDTICPGDDVFINGTLYDENNLTGIEIIPTGNLSGCDSTVFVQLSLASTTPNFIRQSLCPGEFILVNGSVYDQNRRSGFERLPGAQTNGCDSIIDIVLDYYEEALSSINDTLCSNDFIEVNGVIYNSQNPSGVEIIDQGSLQGCDSTINIDLYFLPELIGNYTDTLCVGEEVSINGSVYNQQNPSGIELLSSHRNANCDSTVTIQLVFRDTPMTAITQTLCQGESIVINGQVYNENRPQGLEILNGQSVNGCDSFVQIQLNFLNRPFNLSQDTICLGEQYDWNGLMLDQQGIYYDTISAGAINGCDSIISLELLVVDVLSSLSEPAGDDQDVCGDRVQLAAQLIDGTLGTWQSSDGLIFSDANDPFAEVSGLTEGVFTIYWEVLSTQCNLRLLDSLELSVAEKPIAIDDTFEFTVDQMSFDFNVLLNDDVTVVPNREVFLLDQPETGRLENIAGGKYRYFLPDNINEDTLSFSYQICNNDCPDQCDTAIVQLVPLIELPEPEEEIFIPSGITANNDGVNDNFFIPILDEQPDRFPNNELVIFNRWGQVVFQQSNYQNNWMGTDGQGKELAAGTYYYVLKLSVVDGLIFKGDLTIVK